MQIIPPEKGYPEFAGFRTPAVRWLLAIALWSGMSSFFVAQGLLTYLSQISPASPDSTTGQVFELNNHGRFYVREAAALVFNLLCWGGWMLGAFGLVASMSVFGQDAGHSRVLAYAGVAVLLIAFVMAGAEMLTSWRIPFDMASWL